MVLQLACSCCCCRCTAAATQPQRNLTECSPSPLTTVLPPSLPCSFAGWVFIMTCFVYWMLPETKGVPVESVPALFARHWAWKKVRPGPLGGCNNGAAEKQTLVGR